MSEAEVMLEPDAFEAVRRGTVPAPLPLATAGQVGPYVLPAFVCDAPLPSFTPPSGEWTFVVVESQSGRRTGRWIALRFWITLCEVGNAIFDPVLSPAWPPLAACHARNTAAARIARED